MSGLRNYQIQELADKIVKNISENTQSTYLRELILKYMGEYLVKNNLLGTTKVCPECGNDKLILLRTLNQKVCQNFKEHKSGKDVIIPWFLDKNQKPLL